jgi:AcrR family transcriptional regulator
MRNAIMAAAIRGIAAQGLSASTALIAREAGVSNGSLFIYFETKAALVNQLYLELKSEMALVALERLPTGVELRDQMFHIWSNWMRLAVSNPENRRARISPPNAPFGPTDLPHTAPAHFLTRWLTHSSAPIFIFLAGIGAFLAGLLQAKITHLDDGVRPGH